MKYVTVTLLDETYDALLAYSEALESDAGFKAILDARSVVLNTNALVALATAVEAHHKKPCLIY